MIYNDVALPVLCNSLLVLQNCFSMIRTLRYIMAVSLTALTLGLQAQTLVHYWNFNNSTTLTDLFTPTQVGVPGAAIEHIMGGTSLVQITNNTGSGFDVTNPNARNGDAAATHIRFNNPIGGALLFSLPTTGYQQVVVKYGTRRSGSGAGTQIIEYSTDGVNFTFFGNVIPVDGDPIVETLDFSGIPAVNDNANFKIRISFEQGGGGTVGNNRFDNFTLEGITAGVDNVPPVVSISPLNGAIDQLTSIQPSIQFNEDVRLLNDNPITDTDIPAIVALRLNDAQGADVPFTGTIAGKTITITPNPALNFGQTYYLELKANTVEDLSDNAVTAAQSTSFTTLQPQTSFQAGDIVPVAYRMNTSNADDEVGFVTFVNILPGTKIRMTDAKYTDNTPAQCPGGIEWTSPNTVIPAGTFFIIQNDVPSASIGTVSGSGFGLSSSGDQMIVYTGVNTNPSYVTALSSNAWLTGAHTICNGSLSKLPAGLVDGLSSINLSTCPDNVGGNTVNAYYNGPQTGSVGDLKAAILNPANWVGTAAGTPAQVWPNYNFPGAPRVLSAEVTSATSIRLAFNNDLNLLSAANTVFYTGIGGLGTADVSNNGTAPDTVTLNYAVPFVSGNTYTLSVFGITDAENRSMVDTFSFSFTYVTKLGFDQRYISVSEDAGFVTIDLNLENPSIASVDLVHSINFGTTSVFGDFQFPGTQTLNLTGNSSTKQTILIPIIDDTEEEQDEYFVLSLVNANGLTIDGLPFITIYIRDNDRKAPQASKEIELAFTSRYTVNNPTGEEGLAEIVAYDPGSKRLFTISTALKQFDIIDFSNPANPVNIAVVDVSPYGSGITSVAVKNGLVAVSVPGINNEQENGSVVFFDVNGVFQKSVTVGALPDMIVFTPDGNAVLTANEGQPNDAYTIDPEGSISIIDLSNGIAAVSQASVTTVPFTEFNAQEPALLASGVRKLYAPSTLAQDFEPEYITISPDSKKAWITLQENNAVLKLDLASKTFDGIAPLGTKNHRVFGNGLDLSDQNNQIHIANWPVKAFFLPDAITNYEVDGVTYLITANEGDEKEYAGLNERTTVSAVTLDPVVFPNAAMLKEPHNMGRFRISNLQGDTDGDGDFDELYCVGARSFSIWDEASASLVFDSGDDFEKITSEDPLTAPIFNTDNAGNGFKARSRAKGPEPEGVTVARLNGRMYAFITLERIGGMMVYDVTDPTDVTFTDYINTRDNTSFAGDNGPEGVLFIANADSPDGEAYVISANEISGTLAIFRLNNVVSTNDVLAQNEPITLFPNPAGNEQVFFSRSSDYMIFNINGQLVHRGKNAASVDVSGLESGVYMLRFANGSMSKLVKQ